MWFYIRFQIQLFVISLVVLKHISCDKPDICYGSAITAIERVVFLDGIDRYFVSSGAYYWFVNQTTDLPTSHSAQELPNGFSADAALMKDTRGCQGGQYALTLIQKNDLNKEEEEWRTMDFVIGEWGANGTDAGQWSEPTRIARCLVESKVCSTSDNYFATMNFDFKRALDAAFGVIGHNAYFIQDSLIYNVSYVTPCVKRPYSQVFAQSPQPLPTRVSAGFINDNQIILFDREFYTNFSIDMNITAEDLEDSDNWSQAPNNFFTACSPLTTTFGSILHDIFTDSRNRSITATLLIVIIIVCLLVIIAVLSLIVCMSFRRKTMRITSNAENADNSSDSPLHEEHLLKSDSPKVVSNNDNNKESPNQVRIPLQTSC